MDARSSDAATRATPFTDWWRDHVTKTVDHHAVVQKVHEESDWSSHYLFMTLMSAGIAVLGLLLSSPAVVIGAMLISPLMGPIIGIGFAIATFDAYELRRTATTLAIGVALAVLFCALIVLASPLKTVTSEIAMRTRPNLFDLLVALFSGMAGTYAMIRGRHGTIVGVAIATAIMPPLAVIGFGLATLNMTVLLGSALLFFTNLMTISVTAAVLARLYGFASNLSPRQTGLQASFIVTILLALGVPLALSLKQIAWETIASRQARETITAHFGEHARLSEVSIDYDATPLAVDATVFTPEYRDNAGAELAQRLSLLLNSPVEVNVDQFRVGTGRGQAEASEIAAARNTAAEANRAQLAERVALIAGVAPGEVLIDRSRRVARVIAKPLPGTALPGYRALEARLAAVERGWTIEIVPPAGELADATFEDGELDEAGGEAVATAAWAAQRLALPVGLAGRDPGTVEAVAAALEKAGVEVRRLGAAGAAPGVVEMRWMAPAAAESP